MLVAVPRGTFRHVVEVDYRPGNPDGLTWQGRDALNRSAAGERRQELDRRADRDDDLVVRTGCPPGSSPISTEQAPRTSSSRVPGCRSTARRRTSASVMRPLTGRSSWAVPAAAFAAAQ